MESARLFALPAVEDVVGSPLGVSYSVAGRIAELRAEIRLLELGHRVAAPGLDDDGVDLVVDYRLAVQVKSAAAPSDLRNGSEAWLFEFGRSKRDKHGPGYSRFVADRSHVDFVLCFARDAEIWWVVPRADVPEGQRRVRVVPGGMNDRRWREAWHLLREAV